MVRRTGDSTSFQDDGQSIAEALDDLRERMIAAEVPWSVVTLFFDAATATWDAVNALAEASE